MNHGDIQFKITVAPIPRQFINFLARDMDTHPEHLESINAGLRKRIKALTKNVEVDLDAPLLPQNE